MTFLNLKVIPVIAIIWRPTLRRTLVRVVEISQNGVVHAVVPSWNPHKIVTFPQNIIQQELQKFLSEKPPIWFFARVNTSAENSSELRFENFEIAPEPDDDGF